jgi:2-hydroxychromene-2-carboxylate isomerase
MSITKACGLSQIDHTTLAHPEAQLKLDAAAKQAIARGVFGVPSFWVSAAGQDQGQLYWGQDRMHFVEAQLLALARGTSWAGVPDLARLVPRVLPGQPAKEPTHLRFWYDFASTWSYVAWIQMEQVLAEAGPNCLLEMKPILLGALFRE